MESTVAEFWKVVLIPAPTPRWSGGRHIDRRDQYAERGVGQRNRPTCSSPPRSSSPRPSPAHRGGARRAWLGALVAAALASTALTGPAVAASAAQNGDGNGNGSVAAAGRAGHHATQQQLDAAVSDGVPGGLAQVTDRDGVWNGAAGVADRTTGRERLPRDTYRIASLTKTFVATVLLQLEAEGRLDLDDTVESRLPGVVRGSGHDGRTVTVRQLLNHTSGIFNYNSDPEFRQKVAGDGFLTYRYNTWQPEQLIALAMSHPPYFAPGTDFHYSNTNYILAGMIVERVTGRPYGTEIERRILRPLKLRATSAPGTDVRMPHPSGRAYSKLLSPDPAAEIHDVTELNPTVAGASGSMISNSADLQRFYRALLRGELLPAEQLTEMMDTVDVGAGAPSGYGYGLGLLRQQLPCGVEIWGHGGDTRGSQSAVAMTRDGSHSIAFNFNADWAGDTEKVVTAEFCG
ncbi:beta-lactamase family protein [Streptomyces scopuliridis]|uniref:Beta-lactamase family protein n=1 Tax=Streptomyces scopuliridis TaxID=452529 RepID=A0ACD4ZEV4_9ACTN|nr:serine hydrolase domain-containing protein [Streptomyces scopuliridis]WSB96551.1 beta-lactamase family protein [Streptomyces scopuliridis]WSC09745.1 beta-lactamase family protein [Streptomyces scopuliridis]